ncbi:hypothetical protein BO83DRAFT_403630 [Aspergillus eucalypticola CBS 122712]|uniref:Uncharacterized protein n=1 Tax=Aspergillus eucalypticola (strain CBS 122712 / IBT 29274) TaxID=1448314 RepID=A0A317ULY6_ASPEC|nr:uncharacterized protein BO83DRAFT_403630 [Aspergillus eucalypticola CBS 122712]PWY62711.1 hypothetical protein BO83DRAFT_403630 [Aspergillus eucalypticola CBS 122712]
MLGLNMHDGMRVNEMKLDGVSWKAGWQVGRPLKLNPARAQIMVQISDVQVAALRLQERPFLISGVENPSDEESTGYSIKCTPDDQQHLIYLDHSWYHFEPSAQHRNSTFWTRPSFVPYFPPPFFWKFKKKLFELSDIFAICGPEPVNRRGLPFGFAAASGSAALSHPYVHLSEVLAATSDPRCISTSVSELTAVRSI